MKRLIRFACIALLVFGLERVIRLQTEGFRIEKTYSQYAPREEWAIQEPLSNPEILNQSFYFLGSGVQCYAFISEDGKTVLKLFKHHHFGLNSQTLASLPLPRFLAKYRDSKLDDRQKRMESIFTSALIAKSDLAAQTGVFFLNLNQTKEQFPTITLYDKIGVRHKLDLNHAPFLLQQKADPIFTYLATHKHEAKSIIDSLFSCIKKRSELGIANTDPIIHKNFGILQGNVVEIDVGSFIENPYTQSSLFSKRELFYETLELKDWLTKNAPELTEYFDQSLLQAIRT